MHFDEKSMWAFRLDQDPTFQGDYMAGMGVCEDPSCPCAVATIGCKEANPGPDAAIGIPYIFQLDLDTRKVVKSSSKECIPLCETRVDRKLESGESEIPVQHQGDRE